MRGHGFEAFQAGGNNSTEELQQELRRHLATRLGRCMAAAEADSFNCMKLAHYLSTYSACFEPFLQRPVKILEIGVQHGGSLRLWQNYFGPALLQWTGIDIDPRCQALNQSIRDGRHQVCIGSQADAAFLHQVGEQRGPFDIVIDDGSHHSTHIISAFEELISHVSSHGLYIIEDIHATYWQGFRAEGGQPNAMDYFFRLAHGLNREACLHPRRATELSSMELGEGVEAISQRISRIEFLPSLILCHLAPRGPLIEWKAGQGSILRPPRSAP